MKVHPILTQLINTVLHLQEFYKQELINVNIYFKEADLIIKNPSLEDIELLAGETEATDNILVTITIQTVPNPYDEMDEIQEYEGSLPLERVTNSLAIVDKILSKTINGWTMAQWEEYAEELHHPTLCMRKTELTGKEVYCSCDKGEAYECSQDL